MLREVLREGRWVMGVWFVVGTTPYVGAYKRDYAALRWRLQSVVEEPLKFDVREMIMVSRGEIC